MFEGKFELKFILTFRVSVETCSGVTERLKFLPLKQKTQTWTVLKGTSSFQTFNIPKGPRMGGSTRPKFLTFFSNLGR